MRRAYKTSDFDFDLPEHLIAQDLAVPRDSCKLLVYDTSKDLILHKKFFDLYDFLGEKDLLVLNRSKVIRSRLVFALNNRDVEVFFLKELSGGIYRVLVRPGKQFLAGTRFVLPGDLEAEVVNINDDGSREIICNFDRFDGFVEYLNEYGEMPLPPYIKQSKREDGFYQTVYSKEHGSVAAPTAGLHFTKDLLKNLDFKGVDMSEVILHVGRGTFLPVKADSILDHTMHSEYFSIGREQADQLNSGLRTGKRFVAVGTTSVRVLESAFKNGFEFGDGETDIFITPGYKWKVVGGLITNFHLPKSTLIMLVASFLESKGVKDPVSKVLKIYKTAIENEYKFYSFGDSMFII